MNWCALFFFFQISEHIQDAIVYLDAGSTESFQFIAAYPILLELGARAICSLENMCPLDLVSAGIILDCCSSCLSVLSVSYQDLIIISLSDLLMNFFEDITIFLFLKMIISHAFTWNEYLLVIRVWIFTLRILSSCQTL